MADKLSYVLITPYSLMKSRTGGIIGRILALSRDVRFVGARMYAPTDEMVDAYLETLSSESHTPTVHDALTQYVDRNLRRDNPIGISNRMMLLLFEGPEPIRSLREDVVGALSPDMRGDTIRGTYGDFVLEHGKLAFFEPAVLVPTTEEANQRQLKVLSDHAMTSGGILDRVIRYPDRSKVQTTLIIIKPDNFMRRSSRPGNIIDMFSRTGLYVVAAKLLQMRREQAEEFYGPLRQIFQKKLAKQVAAKAGDALSKAFDFPITDEMKAKVADVFKDTNAEFEFSKIVNYMTGSDQTGENQSPEERGKCLALLYQGVDAIEKIRKRLGSTNPKEAEAGTVRSVYGYDLMKNGAHASDSPESAERERKIIGLWDEGESCETQNVINKYLARAPKE